MKVYIVRSKDGKYFRAKGYGGYGDNWVDEMDKAKVYTKIGSARRTVTYFNNTFPEYGTPDLLEFTLDNFVVLDESERIKKAREKKEKAKLNREINSAKRNMEIAKSKFDDAQNAKNKYEKLKKEYEELAKKQNGSNSKF